MYRKTRDPREEKVQRLQTNRHCRRNCDLSSHTKSFCNESSTLSRGFRAPGDSKEPIAIASLERGDSSAEALREEYGDEGPGGGEGV
jgi:hypothetical protein